jgi:adenylate cyclase
LTEWSTTISRPEGDKYIAGPNIEDIKAARWIAEEAIAICPDVSPAYVLLGHVHHLEYSLGSGKSAQDSIEKAIAMAPKAIALDDSIAEGHALLGNFYSIKREHEKTIAEGERAVSLNPRLARANSSYGNSLLNAGRAEEAIPFFQKAIRFCPISGSTNFLPLGNALRETGRFEEAVSEYKKAIQRSPDNIFAHIFLTACYSMTGREKEARAEAAEVLRIDPKFSVDYYAKVAAYKD